MFCPTIKDECRPDCVKWSAVLGKCLDVITAEAYARSAKYMDSYEYYMQMMQISWRLQMKHLLNDPAVPEDIKEAIQQAKDAVALEKLLREADLL